MESLGEASVEKEAVGEVSEVAHVVHRKGEEGELVAIDCFTADLRQGEFALGGSMVNGMGPKDSHQPTNFFAGTNFEFKLLE